MKNSRHRAGIWTLVILLASCGPKTATDSPLENSPPASPPTRIVATVTDDRLRVRRLPYLDQEIVGYLMAGDEVTVESRTIWTEVIGDHEAPWYFVRTEDLAGWTYGGFLTFPAGDVGAVTADTAFAPPPKTTTEAKTDTDSLDPDGLPELLLPVFGMEKEIEVNRPREGTITYDSVNEILVLPYGFSADSPLGKLIKGRAASGLRIVAESPDSSHFERTFVPGDLGRLSETASSLPSGFPDGADALLIPFYRLATLKEGSWEFYAFIGEEGWPISVGKADITPSEASILRVSNPDPFRDSPRSEFQRGEVAYLFGHFPGKKTTLQVALYHDTEEFRNGKILLEPVKVKQCTTENSGAWSTTMRIDESIPNGRCWIAVGQPIESVDNLRLFITSLQL